MNNNIISSIVALALSVLTCYGLVNLLESYTIHPSVESSVDQMQIVKIFLSCLLYFLALITLPFVLRKSTKVKSWSNPKLFLYLELIIIGLSFLATPFHLSTKLLFLIICQPIVLVNFFAIKPGRET